MGRFYAESIGTLRQCVTDFNRRNLAFAVQLGDLVDGGLKAEIEMQSVGGVYDQLTMPHHHVLGNHEFNGLDRERAMRILGMEEAWYSFDVGNWRFVVLDTQDVAVQGGWNERDEHYRQAVAMLGRLKDVGAENAQDYNGGFGDAQLRWLDEILTQADLQERPVIVFCHLPLMPPAEKYTAWNADQAVAVFEKHACVKACFSGHHHTGGYARQNAIHYITLEAMVDAVETGGAWAIVTLSNDQIQIEGVGAVTRRTLSLK